MSEMNSIQKNLFQLLIEFDDICKKFGINYLLAAGASLGAVRNRRFIPWDDDIDLYITRENWNKLRHILESEDNVLPESRLFVYKENTPYYCNPLPRYTDVTTTTIYQSQALAGKACGQHLELFIFDPMPLGEKEKEKYLDLLHVYTELLSPYFVVNENASLDDWQKHYELYEKYSHRIDKEGEKKVIEELEKELQQYSSEECDQYCMRWGKKNYIYDKELFEQGQFGVFEGKEFPIGKYPESMLRVAYGDNWMYVPEYEEQVVHGGLKYADKSFYEFTDRYINKINRGSVFKKYQKNKRNNVKVFYNKQKYLMLSAKEKVIVESKHFIDSLNNKEKYLEELLQNKDYTSLSIEFEKFRNLQLNSYVRKFNILVPISDNNLKTFLLSLIEQGQYYEINKYLDIRKVQEKQLPNDFEDIEKLRDSCRELSIARYDKKDVDLVESLILKYDDVYPDLLDIYRAKVWLLESNADCFEDFKNIDKYCNQILKIYPFDGEIMASQAKAKLELGERENALKLYRKSVETTRNALIWQKVEEESGISRIDIEREIIRELNHEN